MTAQITIFLAGASRGVGREVAKRLAQDKSLNLIAMLRSDATRPELEAMGIRVVMADALDATAVKQAMGTEPIAVVSTIGGVPKDGQRADYLGNKNLIDAAVEAKVKKFILISSIGSGESAVALPPQALQTLGPVLAEKEQAEAHLIASGLIYTIIRPGGLKSEPATGNGVVTEDYRVGGTIHRADVAQLVCQCLDSEAANHKILSAVDRTMAYTENPLEELDLK